MSGNECMCLKNVLSGNRFALWKCVKEGKHLHTDTYPSISPYKESTLTVNVEGCYDRIENTTLSYIKIKTMHCK